MSYLYNSDVKHYRDNFWATADMKRLSGTTTLDNEILKDTDDKKSSEKFLLAEQKLMTNMLVSEWILKIRTKTLTAKKSYFILNDKIVFLMALKVLIHQKIQLQRLKIAKRMGIRYIQTINKPQLQMIRKPIPSFSSTDTKRTSVIIFKRIENNCKKRKSYW